MFNILECNAEGDIENINTVGVPRIIDTNSDKAFSLQYEAGIYKNAGAQVEFISEDQFVVINGSGRAVKIVYAEEV